MLSDSIYQEEHIPTQFERFWRSFRANNLAMFGLWSLLFIALVTILSPWIAPYDPQMHSSVLLLPPSWEPEVPLIISLAPMIWGEISCLA